MKIAVRTCKSATEQTTKNVRNGFERTFKVLVSVTNVTFVWNTRLTNVFFQLLTFIYSAI